MLGKEKCRMLREIRRRIADENDIPYVTADCRFQGECKGTCPKCESELRYLEKQLALRTSLGKRVTVAALCAGMAFAAAGCTVTELLPSGRGPEPELSGAIAFTEPSPTPEPRLYPETGEVAWPEDEEGELPEPTEYELMGGVLYVEPESHD